MINELYEVLNGYYSFKSWRSIIINWQNILRGFLISGILQFRETREAGLHHNESGPEVYFFKRYIFFEEKS